MKENLQEQFFAKLAEKYGPKDLITSRFGNSSFGSISDQLSISASQFSKLISGTATEGMYQRTIKNIDRLLLRESLTMKLDDSSQELTATKEIMAGVISREKKSKRLILFLFGSLMIVGIVLILSFLKNSENQVTSDQANSHPLGAFFDREFTSSYNSPYLDFNEVQEYCPGSAFEGIWSLAKSYKLPIPSRNTGLYYVAKSADVRIKCSKSDTYYPGKGKVLWGYEHLVNEIWVDTRMRPLSPTYFDKETKQFTAAFDNLQFDTDPDFKKVATIYSFFIDRFQLRPDSILRHGEPCGRYVSAIDEDLAREFEVDINYILEDVLSDMTTTRCEATINPFCDPNTLTENQSIFSFDCVYTIGNENLGIGGGYPYQKGYLLEKQNYSNNLTCDCHSEEPSPIN